MNNGDFWNVVLALYRNCSKVAKIECMAEYLLDPYAKVGFVRKDLVGFAGLPAYGSHPRGLYVRVNG